MSTLHQLCFSVCVWVQPFLELLAQMWQMGRDVTLEDTHDVHASWHLVQKKFLHSRDILWNLHNANLALLSCSFFFLLNFNSTNNNWHLKSPQGSAASCQREIQYSGWRNQCAQACVIKSVSVSNNNRLKAYNGARLPVCAPGVVWCVGETCYL